MLAKKEALKDAINAKKSPGSRLDWAFRQETRAKESVSQLEDTISQLQTELEEKQDALVQAKKELEDAHVQVIAIKADVASDPDLEVKDAAAHTEVVNNLADDIVKKLSRYPQFAPGTEQVRTWVRAQMATTSAGVGSGVWKVPGGIAKVAMPRHRKRIGRVQVTDLRVTGLHFLGPSKISKKTRQ